MKDVILWQRLEGALVFVAGLAMVPLAGADLPWWLMFVAFFAPDLSFLAYGLGPRIGALGYNLVHLYAFGLGLFVLGLLLASPLAAALGALWLAHSGFDRMLGYGLKSAESFHQTHLGPIGRRRS